MASTFAFPASPTVGQTVTLSNGTQIKWSGTSWAVVTDTGGGGGSAFTESETAPTSPAIGDTWLVPSTGTWYQRVTNASAGGIWVEINAAGVSGGSAVSGYGTATLDFGVGSNEASVVISGQTQITGSRVPKVAFSYVTLGDKTPNDHRYAAALTSLMCGPINTGVGFTVYATSSEALSGSYTIQFYWN